MHTPHNGRGDHQPDARAETSETCTVGTVEHCTCGLAGLLATGVLVVLLYPLLVALTQPLYVLSSTALVFIAVGVWLASWLSLELVWEWRAGRLTTGS